MRAFTFIFGLIFLIIGVAGFVPGFTTGEHLVDVFRVNIWINCVHILAGVYAFIAGFWSRFASRLFFQIIGVVFAILALLGFVYGDREIFGLLANNSPNTWFHVIMAIAALILGFGGRD